MQALGGDIVVDTSAVIEIVCALRPDPDLVARLATGERLFVPHVLDIEVISVIRRLERIKLIQTERAAVALSLFSELALSRVSHEPLRGRIWDLRGNVAPHDASFVALAEALDAPLVTCDGKLSRATGPRCRFEIYGTAA